MYLVQIVIVPSIAQTNEVLKNAFDNLKVWTRVVKNKFVAEKDEILFSLRREKKLDAAEFLENKKDFQQLIFDKDECVLSEE
ncbi:hypothetical protein IT402_00815 [Candidatus Nomurabacteria bacterium]|nr:hypothetical protein [Candidatus Nomurabacteria bacterium]